MTITLPRPALPAKVTLPSEAPARALSTYVLDVRNVSPDVLAAFRRAFGLSGDHPVAIDRLLGDSGPVVRLSTTVATTITVPIGAAL